MNNNRLYLPGLNGLRALAALSVLFSHIFQDTFGNWGLEYVKLPLFLDGVTLFFVISGFLITFLLLHEYEKYATVDVSKFYIRRILRIWPIYYFYIILVIAVLYAVGKEFEIMNGTLYYYVFFAANIPFLSYSGIPLIAHYWSIGVEEQFYLFWPWFLKLTRNKLLVGVFSVLLFWVFLKMGSYVFFSSKSLIYKFFNVTRFHCMMIGALGAIGFYNKNVWFMKLFTNKWLQIISWLCFIFSGFFFGFIPAVVTAEFIAVLSLFLIMSQVEGIPKFINLENRYFDFIGKISYGIYVLHPLVICLLSSIWLNLGFTFPVFLQYVIIYLSVPCITILVAWISYEKIEKRFLKFKDRYALVESSNSMRHK